MPWNTEHWILIEFIDGPRHGELLRVEAPDAESLTRALVGVMSNADGYQLRLPPASALDFEHWVAHERSRVETFGRGAPAFFTQLVHLQDSVEQLLRDVAGSIHPSISGLAPGPRMTKALLAGDEAAAHDESDRLMAEGCSMTDVIELALAPAMREVGNGWRVGLVTVGIEHRATCIALALLEQRRPTTRPQRGRALTATVPSDRHGLASLMATTALRDDGWEVVRLGAEPTQEALLNMACELEPDLVVLSATLPHLADAAQATVAALQACDLRVLAGAPGETLRDLQRKAR